MKLIGESSARFFFADFLFYFIPVNHDGCNETKTQKLGNYKTHLLSHECNEPLDQTGAELENLGHSVQALLVSFRLLLQYHSIEIDINRKGPKNKAPL